ncbi:hypothetical protein GCM10023189_44540 [Nibrella saemangeumensis]|uniref:Uncharacterized protein n=1 Tax=Nibrella saemangeumensis TaxID=1084526 RepID=A0ABP8NFY8_9BACT
MIYVINLEDGGGIEFFFAKGSGKLIKMADQSPEEPQEFRTFKLAWKKVNEYRQKYPAVCQLYVVDRKEFNNRRQILQTPRPKPDPAPFKLED